MTPNRLLLPAAADDSQIAVAENVVAPAAMAWRWAAGEFAMPRPWIEPEDKAVDIGRAAAFPIVNRPHDPSRIGPELTASQEQALARLNSALIEGLRRWLFNKPASASSRPPATRSSARTGGGPVASVKCPQDGVYRARYRDAGGREHARHFQRRVDAQRRLDEVTASVVTGQYVDPKAGKITFKEYAERWRANADHGPQTRELVKRKLDRHVYPTLGARPIGSIMESDVRSLQVKLSKTLAASTRRVLHSYLVAIFRSAVRDKVIVASPCADMKPPEARPRRVDPLPLR